jgi:hypothetical protein
MPKVIIDKAVPNYQGDYTPKVTEVGESSDELAPFLRGRDRIAQVPYDSFAAFVAAEFGGVNDFLLNGSLVLVKSVDANLGGYVTYISDDIDGRARPLNNILVRVGLAGTPSGRTESMSLPGISEKTIGAASGGGFPGISLQTATPSGLVNYDSTNGFYSFNEYSGFADVHVSGGWEASAQPLDVVVVLQRETPIGSGTWADLREFVSFEVTSTEQKPSNWSVRQVIVNPSVLYRIRVKRTDNGGVANIVWREPSVEWSVSIEG